MEIRSATASRRSFLLLCSSALMVNFGCRKADPVWTKTLSVPYSLSHLCDSAELKKIGNAYRSIRKDEAGEQALQKLILQDITSASLNPDDVVAINRRIEKQIQHDYANGQTIKIEGWILSITEARQCALFALNNQ